MFSAPARHSLPSGRVLCLGEATCLQLALSSFAEAKDRFALANLRPSFSSVFSFASAKQCFWEGFAFLLFLPSSFLALLSIPTKLKQMED